MRTFHWLSLITLTLFLGTVVINGQGGPQTAPCDLPTAAATPPTPAGKVAPSGLAPKARIKDIMNSMMVPSSNYVWNAVATVTDETGVHEARPKTDEDWNNLYANAVELTEVANLLMLPGRERCLGGAIPVQYRTDFNQKARELLEAGNIAVIAAKKHDSDAVAEAGERIDVACDACHEKYQLTEGDPENAKKVLGTYKLTAAEKSGAAPAQPPAAAKPAAAPKPAAAAKPPAAAARK